MRPLAIIDLSVRVGNGTYVGFEDIHWEFSPFMLHQGQEIDVVESESGLHGNGTVSAVVTSESLVYIDLDFSTLKEAEPDA